MTYEQERDARTREHKLNSAAEKKERDINRWVDNSMGVGASLLVAGTILTLAFLTKSCNVEVSQIESTWKGHTHNE
jgi:hypothetical protein